MAENSSATAKYVYIHDQKYPSEAIDIHHIESRRCGAKLFLCAFLAVLVLGNALYLVLIKDNSFTLLLSSFLLCALLREVLRLRVVKKESVVIIPFLGVQLETLYLSGRVTRQFVPIGKILKPVLQECVTPVTCYWSLSLVLREEEALTLVFKEFRPPLKLLIPVWKALSVAIDEGCACVCREDAISSIA